MHHYAEQLGSPFPLLAAIGARKKRIEIGTAVIDMRYENPYYMIEDAGAADLISGGRLQLGISRGSPEQVIDGWRYFGYEPPDGGTDADLGRRHGEEFLDLLRGEGFAPQPNLGDRCFQIRRDCFASNRTQRACAIASGGALRPTRLRCGLRERKGMNMQSSTLKLDESGEPFPRSAGQWQIRLYREAWTAAGHTRVPRVSVSRSIFAIMNDRDRMYFGQDESSDHVGVIDDFRAVFGRTYAGEPDALIEQAEEAMRPSPKRTLFC